MISIESVIDTIGYYKIVIAAASLLLFAIFVHFRGTKKNLALVQQHMKLISPVLASHFPKFEGEIVAETSNVFKVYAEGRKSCIFAIVGFAVEFE